MFANEKTFTFYVWAFNSNTLRARDREGEEQGERRRAKEM